MIRAERALLELWSMANKKRWEVVMMGFGVPASLRLLSSGWKLERRSMATGSRFASQRINRIDPECSVTLQCDWLPSMSQQCVGVYDPSRYLLDM